MKNVSAFSSFMARMAMTMLVALLGFTQGVWATDFITDVMVIGNSNKSALDNLENSLKNQGWTAINKDLNEGCGTGSDYIHLLYKKESSPGSSRRPITDFYIRIGKNPPKSLTHEGRTYYLASCQGSDDFVDSYGDLNNNAEGDYIFLYYTKNVLPNYNAVTGITFNTTKSGAVGENGGTTSCDLNKGAGGAYIYMHVTKARTPVVITSSTNEVTLLDGDLVSGTGGWTTQVSVADGATVTLSGLDITGIPDYESHIWPGINCLGDAVIVLADGTMNKVKGGYHCSGIFVPEGHTLTIRGNGSLDVTTGRFGAGIGSGYENSCGDIVIEGGNITTTGNNSSPGIGSGFKGSCGDIFIGDGITRVTATMGIYAWTAIGPAIYGTCGTINLAPSLIDLYVGESQVIFPLQPFNSSNNKLYTLTSKRGGLVMNAEGTGVAAGQKRTDAPDEDKRFAIITYEGKQYLYNPKAKMFLRHDGTFVRRLGTPIIIDGSNPDGDYQHMLFMKNGAGELMAFNNNGNVIEISNWHTPDDGNRWRIEPVADFNPKEALAISELKLYDNVSNADILASYDNLCASVMLSGRTLYCDGTWNTLCLPFDVDDFNGTPLEAFTAMELDTETAHDSHMTGFDAMDIAYHLNFKPATSIKAGKPYIVKSNPILVIGSTADWNAFAASVESGTTYEGEFVFLTADITVSTMVGTSNHRFKGTFNGNGHLLTVANLPATGQYCAPFRYVDGATIQYLHTAGNLSAAEKYRSGLIGESNGRVTISNCWSSVAINSSINGDGTHGGFIGEVKEGSNVVMDNCLFDGSFTGSNTNCWGGFVGWSQGVTVIKNSTFLPEGIYSLDSSGSRTFGRNNVNTENCYYSVALGELQGTAVGNMTATQLAEALGGGWQVKDGKALPVMTRNVITDPVFYGVTIKNVTPATVISADSTVCFTGSYSPVAIGANDHTKLYLGENNMLHYPYANMSINSFRAGFQVKTSSMGDVNDDGDVSVDDVATMVNHILGAGNDKFVEDRADLNGDGEITVNDVAVLVGMILTEIQDLNIVVFTGDTPITYGSGGRSAARVPKTILGHDE